MKFVDMDVDCIESCLEHLSFDELLSAAASNKRINQAAKFIYSRKFSSKKISFSVNKGFEAQLVNRIVYFGDDSLEDHSFRDLKSSLKFLRCFGQLLTNIEILFQNDMQNDMFMFGDFPDGRNAPNKFIWTQHVIEYVNEYCAESLLDVHFYGIRDLPNYLTKPFSRVKNITLENCYFSDLVENNWLNDRFPRMQELHLNLTYSNDVGSFKSIENCFGFLEDLIIRIHIPSFVPPIRIGEKNPFHLFRGNVLELLRLNHQIKHFSFRNENFTFIGANDLQSVNKSLQNLESLKLNIHYQFNSGFNGDFIHFKNLKSLTCYVKVALSFPIPFVSDKLDTLHLVNRKPLSEFEYEFIAKHPTITQLSYINGGNQGTDVNISKIANALPSIERLAIEQFIKIESLIPHWTKFQKLKEISFRYKGLVQQNELVPLLIDGWSVSIVPIGFIKLIRSK